jgi:DNA-binding MarR family transcriptional regulator
MARSQRKKLVHLPESQLDRAEEFFPGSFDRDATRALFALRSLARRINDSADAWLKPFGINAAQQNYLAVLCFSERGLTLNELSSLIHTSNATVTGMVANLLQAGLVERIPNPDDGRSTIIRLTPKGLRLFRRAYPVHHKNVERGMSGLSSSEKRTLANLLLKVGEKF